MDKEKILKIHELREKGLSYTKIAAELLITKSQAVYFSKINLKEYDEKKSARKKYEESVCELANKTRNFNQLCKILGKYPTNETIRSIKNILDKNHIDYSHFISKPYKYNGFRKKKNIDELLISGNTISITHLKERLLNDNIKKYKCEKCGRDEWEGKKIPLQLHHINGNRNDNRLENLQILCPNCHALTDNYCVKKKKAEKNKCSICGKEISRNAKYCAECYHNAKSHKKILMDEKKLIESFKKNGSFKNVAKEFNVSDKTISKWFENLGYPSKSKELRKFFIMKYGNLNWGFLSGNTKAFRDYQKNSFKKIDLIDDFGETLKTYSSVKDIIEDGFYPKSVYKVCRGILKTHHKKKFKYSTKK